MAASARPTFPPPLTRLLLGLCAALLAVSGAAVGAPAAHAASNDTVPRMDVTAVADRERGTLHVTQDFDLQFTGGGDHGPFVYLVTRQAITGDADRWRVLQVSNVHVTSPTGAPAGVMIEKQPTTYGIRIGDPNREVKGLQRYVVTYDLAGVVNPDATGGHGDELYWNVIGTGWQLPMDDITVTLQGPSPVTATNCYAGARGGSGSCTAHTADGAKAVFRQGHLDAGQALTVVGQWPVGTFVDAAPLYARRSTAANTFAVTPATVGTALGSVAVGLAALALVLRRFGRDRAYAGLTPGLTPATGAPTATEVRRRTPVAVRFTPPDDTSAGEAGTVIDGTAGKRDVVASIVDLAVRGHLRIDEVPPAVGPDAGAVRKALADSTDRFTDYRLVRLPADTSALPPYLRRLHDELFRKDDAPLMRKDLGQSIGLLVMRTAGQLNRDMVDRGWYRRRPDVQRGLWILAGALLVLVGGGLTALLALTSGWGLAGLGVVVVGLAVVGAAFLVSARTPEGSAVLAQTQGFREYLLTAEADQLRVEEDHDLFSRYLPWAIAFGVESRWVGLFREIAAAGRPVAEPTWYHTYTGASIFAGDNAFFGADGAFMDVASHSGMWAASSGAGGMSGISGGSVGGGVGGGGGGSW